MFANFDLQSLSLISEKLNVFPNLFYIKIGLQFL